MNKKKQRKEISNKVISNIWLVAFICNLIALIIRFCNKEILFGCWMTFNAIICAYLVYVYRKRG